MIRAGQVALHGSGVAFCFLIKALHLPFDLSPGDVLLKIISSTLIVLLGLSWIIIGMTVWPKGKIKTSDAAGLDNVAQKID